MPWVQPQVLTSYGAGGSASSASPFTYQLYDLFTGSYLGRLPLTGVTFGSQLLTPGQASGTIDLADPRVQNMAVVTNTAPARTALMIDYLGALIWGGVIWNRSYKVDGTGRKLTVTATELWSHFQQRMQATDYSSPPYSGLTGPPPNPPMALWNAASNNNTWDPVLIAMQVIYDALYQSSIYGNILGGLSLAANGYTTAGSYLASGTNTPTGDYLNVNYPLTSLQQVHQIVNMLASNGLGVGFDYAVDVAYSGAPGSVPVATVNLSYPRRGRTYAQNNLVLNCGQAISWEIPEDGTQAANTVYEQGASSSLVVSQNLYPLQAGYPLLEAIKSRSNIQSANLLAILTAMGQADLAMFSFPLATPTVTIDAFAGPIALGEFIVGDNTRLLIPASDGKGGTFDPRLPNGLDGEYRIGGYTVTAADQGQSTLQFNLTVPPPAVATGPQI